MDLVSRWQATRDILVAVEHSHLFISCGIAATPQGRAVVYASYMYRHGGPGALLKAWPFAPMLPVTFRTLLVFFGEDRSALGYDLSVYWGRLEDDDPSVFFLDVLLSHSVSFNPNRNLVSMLQQFFTVTTLAKRTVTSFFTEGRFHILDTPDEVTWPYVNMDESNESSTYDPAVHTPGQPFDFAWVPNHLVDLMSSMVANSFQTSLPNVREWLLSAPFIPETHFRRLLSLLEECHFPALRVLRVDNVLPNDTHVRGRGVLEAIRNYFLLAPRTLRIFHVRIYADKGYTIDELYEVAEEIFAGNPFFLSWVEWNPIPGSLAGFVPWLRYKFIFKRGVRF